MIEAERHELLTELRERLEEFSATYSEMGASLSTIGEARSNFCEKLMLLNGASLTLMFTVVGTAGIRMHVGNHIGDLRGFKIACCLLIVSTIFCILHNQMNTAMLVHEFNARFTLLVQMRMDQVNSVFKKLGLREVGFKPVKPPQTHTKHLISTENVMRVSSTVAQVCTVAAYVALLVFFDGIIQTVLN